MVLSLPPDFKEFLRLLNENDVDYLLIGDYAVGYYGYPRATQDLDVWISKTLENAKKTVIVLQAFGFQTPDIQAELFLKENNIIRMGIPPMRIEILTEISGVDFEACYQERITDNIDGQTVTLISLDRLKENKKASGRYKDLDDLEHLP
jgi:hypothetical protein